MSAPRETPRERLVSAAFVGVERLAMALPERVGRRAFDLAALASFELSSRTRGVVAENLSRVLGRPASSPLVQAAVKDAFRSYARYWFDTFHARVLSDEEIDARELVVGREHMERAFEAGRGALMAIPHLGNWDIAGRWATVQGWPLTAVAELLKPERVFRLFLHHREALGMQVVPLYDDRKVGEELARRLAENHFIALVADRDLKGTGVVVEMFGAERRMPAGPALLSLMTGSPLIPAACYDTEDGWSIVLEEPLEIERTESLRDDVTALTRLLAKRFERSIAAAPTQWHMFQPAWDGEPSEASAAEPVGAAGAATP